MATIYAWASFAKRKNSTKQPTGAGTSHTVRLKDDTAIMQPSFILAGDYFAYNYIQYAGRYYFVEDVISLHNGLVEIQCNIDVLATYKAEIKAASAYVIYYSHNNTEIVDGRLSTKTAITEDSSTQSFNNLGSGTSYMLTAVGEDRTSIFAMDKGDVDSIFDQTLLTQINNLFVNEIANVHTEVAAIAAGDVQTMLQELFDIYFDWLEFQSGVTSEVLFCDDAQKFIKNCFSLPLSKSAIGGSDHSIHLGKWTSGSRGNMGFPRICHDSATLAIPWQASDWRRNAPYHEIYLYIPYIGLITIPPSEVIGVTNLTVNVAIDTYSGVTSFVVNADNGAVLGQYSTNIAAPYAIGSSNIDMVSSGAQIVSGAAAAIGGAMAGNVPIAAAGALGIVNAIRPFDMSVSSNGGAAGMGLGNTVKCFTIFHDTTVSPSSVSAVKGTPFNGVMSLSGVSGYVQTSGASVEIAGYGNEKDMVNNYLNGGIYIE